MAALIPARAQAGAIPARCSFLPPASPTHDSWPAAKRELAPSGATQIRLCRYAFRNNPHSLDGDQLVGHTLIAGNVADKLVRSFDRLRRAKWTRGFTTCFFDQAPVFAYLDYPGDRTVTIEVRNDCFSATNGDLRRNAGDTLKLAEQLTQLTSGKRDRGSASR
jgi:hypothetical protein